MMNSFTRYFGGWSKVLSESNLREVLDVLNIEKLEEITPAFYNIFKAFELCHYDDLKVVMVGMDPYPQEGVATGLLFGNKVETDEKDLSPSLKIIREACINYEIPHGSINFDCTLTSWAKQGVLLLNSALTTRVGHSGAHTMLWRPVICEFLRKLSNEKTGIVYVMFGEVAKTLVPYINKNYNYILTEKHPAYYARAGIKMPHAIFCTINEYMRNLYGEPIKFFEEFN